MESNEQESSAPCSVSWTLQKAWALMCAILLHVCFFIRPLCTPAPSASFYRASNSCANMALPAPKFLISLLCGRLDQYPKSKFPQNLIGAACITCLPPVQSSLAWRVGLCGMWKQECGWSQNDFSRTSRKRCCAGESRSGFKHLFMQPLPDLWPSVNYVISLGLSVFIWQTGVVRFPSQCFRVG